MKMPDVGPMTGGRGGRGATDMTPAPGSARWYNHLERLEDHGGKYNQKYTDQAIDRFLASDQGKYGQAFYFQKGGTKEGLRDWARQILLLE